MQWQMWILHTKCYDAKGGMGKDQDVTLTTANQNYDPQPKDHTASLLTKAKLEG